MATIGILGFAHGHIHAIAGEWNKHPEYGVQLVCGWDGDESRLNGGCTEYAIEKCDSPDELLGRNDIDSVIIAAETLYHSRLASAALRADKKTILYKPLALTLNQADEIVNAAEQSGTPFTMAWQMRTDPVNEEIRRILGSGELGRPYYFRRRHCLSMHNNPSFADTWHVNEALNRDIFADDFSHPADWLNSLFGLPETVACEMSTMHSPRVKNDVASATYRYADGMLAEIMFSASCSAAEITTEIYFEKGALAHYCGDGPGTRLPHTGKPSLKLFREGDSDWTLCDILLPSDQGVRIRAQAKPLGEFLNGKREAICTAAQARDSLRMVLACYLSEREGRRVCLDDERIRDI